MALIPFPPLEPIAGESGRVLTFGRFPNRRYDDRHGASANVRGFGNLAAGQKLTISFGMVPDTLIADVWEAWDAACGDMRPLLLPDKFLFGIKAELLAKIPTTIEWHFDKEMPECDAVGSGMSKLNPITFVGELAERYR